jgi:hypothetical protein
MIPKIPISPHYSFEGTLPSVVKSTLINAGGVLFCLLFLVLLKKLFPDQNFDMVQVAMLTGVGAWLVNLLKVFMEEK